MMGYGHAATHVSRTQSHVARLLLPPATSRRDVDANKRTAGGAAKLRGTRMEPPKMPTSTANAMPIAKSFGVRFGAFLPPAAAFMA